MSLSLNASGNTTHFRNTNLETGFALAAGEHSVVLAVKPTYVDSGDRIMTIGVATTGNAPVDLYMPSSGNLTLRSVAVGGGQIERPATFNNSAWNLMVINFNCLTGAHNYEAQISVNGGAFTTFTNPSGNGTAINRFALGALVYSGFVANHSRIKVGYIATFDDYLTATDVAALWGTNLTTGDALAPWLLTPENGNLLLQASNFATENETIEGGAWAVAAGTDFSYDGADNPVVVTSLATPFNRRRRLILGY